ncbi:MAG: SMC family ATPase [Fimbriimonadaceae bacterium]|nr:SMC family ATPase [Fimbriimonadaceae bacterium]
MKLISLQLKNFRQHKHSKIVFQDGMTAIVGANGSGKSTLLEAITFALFGEQRQKKDTIRFLWSEEGEKFAVKLVFSFDGKTYEVLREEGNAKFQDITGDVPILRASGLTAVTAESKRLLRLNYRQFINSFCAEQKKLSFLDFEQNTKLQEEVGRMLGYDRVGKASQKGREEAREERIRAETIKSNLGDPQELRASIGAEKLEVARIEKTAAENLAQHQLLTSQEASARARRTQADQYCKVFAQRAEVGAKAAGLKSAENLARENLALAKKDVAEREGLLPIEATYESLKADLTRLESERIAESERNQLRARAEDLAKRVADSEAELAKMPAPDLTALEEAIKQVVAEISAATTAALEREGVWKKAAGDAQQAWHTEKAQMEALGKALEKAERAAALGECPECGQPIADSYRDGLSDRRKDIDAFRVRVSELEKAAILAQQLPSDLKVLQENVEQLRTRHSQAQTAFESAKLSAGHRAQRAESLTVDQRALAALREQIGTAANTFDQAAYVQVQEKLKQIEPQHRRFLQLGDAPQRAQIAKESFELAVKNLAEAKEAYDEFTTKLTGLGFESHADAETAIRDHEGLAQRLATATQQLRTDESLLASARERLKTAESRLAEYEAKKGELETRQSSERHLNYASQELASLRERLNRDIGPELEARASENLSALTDGRYPKLTLDANFQPTISDNYYEKPVISGGEEDVLALSLRLALSELIQERNGMPLSLLVLDEVFGGLDEDRRSNVLERLMSLKGKFRQILVISHIEDINQVADQCIYVRRDERGRHSVVSDLAEGDGQALVELAPGTGGSDPEGGSDQMVLAV